MSNPKKKTSFPSAKPKVATPFPDKSPFEDRDRLAAPTAGTTQSGDAAGDKVSPDTLPMSPTHHHDVASNGLGSPIHPGIVPTATNAPEHGPSIGRPVDGLAQWDAEGTSDQAASLMTIRLDQNERLVVPFTTSMLRVDLHFVDFSAIKNYVRCNGPHCLLCRVGRQRDARDLLPVYDVLDRVVAVLAISPNLRPHALRPQIAPVLRRLVDGDGPLLLTLRKDGNDKFLVTTLLLPDGADDGATVIRAFRDRFDADLVDLGSAFQTMANAELATIDEVKSLMAAKGIAL